MLQSLCQNCGDREVGCHSKCAAYLAFRKEKDYENSLRRARTQLESDISGITEKMRRVKGYDKISTIRKGNRG